jgi:hypothetical protein
MGVIGNSLTIANQYYSENFLGTAIVSIAFTFLFLHYEATAHEHITNWVFILLICLNVAIFTILGLFCAWINFMSPTNPTINNVEIGGFSSDFIVKLTYITIQFLSIVHGFIVYIRSLSTVMKIHRITKIVATKMEISCLILLMLYKICFLISLLTDIQSRTGIIKTMGLVFFIIGLFILLFTYIVYPDYLYLLPFPIYCIMLYNKSGILIYNRQFHQINKDKDNAMDNDLMTGMFTAISSLMDETLGKGAILKHFDADKYQIYFKQLPKQSGTLAVIASGNTSLFESSLKRFVRSISDSIIEKICYVATNLNALRPILDDLIKTNFPFVFFD